MRLVTLAQARPMMPCTSLVSHAVCVFAGPPGDHNIRTYIYINIHRGHVEFDSKCILTYMYMLTSPTTACTIHLCSCTGAFFKLATPPCTIRIIVCDLEGSRCTKLLQYEHTYMLAMTHHHCGKAPLISLAALALFHYRLHNAPTTNAYCEGIYMYCRCTCTQTVTTV